MKQRLPTVYLYPEQDEDLVQWLAQLDTQPGVNRSQAIKEALRRGLGLPTSAPLPSPSGPVRGGLAVSASLDAGDLLVDIRQIVEAAVESALGRHALPGVSPVREQSPDEAALTEALLDQLGAALMLGEDEEL